MHQISTTIHNKQIRKNAIEDLPYNPKLKDRAKALRKAGNFAEVVFWKQVRNGTFWNIDFDRQRVIGNYIVDFYIKSLGLVIEIDGESHNNKEAYDQQREKFLQSLGIVIYKTTSFQVKHDLDNVMKNLEVYIMEKFGV